MTLRPILLALALSTATLHAQQPDAAPVNPAATPAARALLAEIDAVSGHATLSGQHNFPNTVSRYSDRVYELTGHYPAVFGQDFGFSAGEDKDSTLGRPAMIQEVIRQYRAGAVIALTWHSVRPTEDEPVTFRDSVQGHLTDWEFHQLLVPGSTLYNRWARQVDTIAGYLQQLQAAGVPVLFRPYHEMNGNWFWWGGRPGPTGSAALYRQLFDRYVHYHHLDNLVWVWNVNVPSVNAGPVDQYFPGSAFADVLSMDIYGPFDQPYYTSMLTLAGPHKPIALAEVGAMPSLEVLAAQPRWAYMMMWSGLAEASNSPAQLQANFHAPNVINRNDPRLPAPLPAPTQPAPPSDPEATPAAKAALAALYTATPNLDELPLNTPIPTTAQTPLLRWLPPSPTGGPITTPLTDFEWSELLRPGTTLHTAWLAEIETLRKQLATTRTAIVLSPLPQANTHAYWWSNRPGPEGSRALIRELHTQLAADHNLLWLWELALAAPAPGTPRPAPLDDFYPGPFGVDALLLDAPPTTPLNPYAARALTTLAGGKPLGLRTQAPTPEPASAFTWTYTAPEPPTR